MRADPVTGHEILFQANSLEINILATLCPGEDVDFGTDITFCIIIWISTWIWNFRFARTADATYVYFIPVISENTISTKMFCVVIRF